MGSLSEKRWKMIHDLLIKMFVFNTISYPSRQSKILRFSHFSFVSFWVCWILISGEKNKHHLHLFFWINIECQLVFQLAAKLCFTVSTPFLCILLHTFYWLFRLQLNIRKFIKGLLSPIHCSRHSKVKDCNIYSISICVCCKNSKAVVSIKEWTLKDLKSFTSNSLFLVFCSKMLMKVFGKRLKKLLDINKSWQQAGLKNNLSVIGHLEMVS